MRDKAFESKNVVFSRTRVEGRSVSGWHHHGARHLYAFVVSGRLRLEFGSKGKEAVELEPGDFIHVPPRLVHRDVNPDEDEELVIVNILVGKGIPVINVPLPAS